jgi:hypothetical protein
MLHTGLRQKTFPESRRAAPTRCSYTRRSDPSTTEPRPQSCRTGRSNVGRRPASLRRWSASAEELRPGPEHLPRGWEPPVPRARHVFKARETIRKGRGQARAARGSLGRVGPGAAVDDAPLPDRQPHSTLCCAHECLALPTCTFLPNTDKRRSLRQRKGALCRCLMVRSNSCPTAGLTRGMGAAAGQMPGRRCGAAFPHHLPHSRWDGLARARMRHA